MAMKDYAELLNNVSTYTLAAKRKDNDLYVCEITFAINAQ